MRRFGVSQSMLRHTMTLAAVVALVSSTACSIHVTTGPSSALYRSTPGQQSGIAWASAPRLAEPHHHDPVQQPSAPTAGDRDEQQRPRPRVSGTVEPRHAGPTNREVITVATSSHTGHRPGQKPTGDLGQWVRPSVNGHSSSVATIDKERPRLNGGHSVSGGNSPTDAHGTLPRGDGRLQQVARQDR